MSRNSILSLALLAVIAAPALAQSSPEPILAQDLTGNWFNPSRDGEGCNLTLEGDDQSMILTCFTYLGGKQVWLIGSNTFDEASGELVIDQFVITSGAQFGSAFRPEDVVREAWGRATLQFADCNTALIEFEPADARFTGFETAYQKIVPGPCNSDRMASASGDTTVIGNWFNPNRDGEGIQVALEGDGATYVATYYTYLNGEQAWIIGSGLLDGTTISFDNMTLTGGADFGPAFDPADVTRTPWGQMVLDITDCSLAQVTFNSALPAFEDFSTQMVKIVQGPCRALTLKGQVTDSPIADATVTAQVGDRQYQTVADANGDYELRVVARSGDEFVRLSATGSEAQPHVQFESLLGSAGRLIDEAGGDNVLSSDENAQTDVTHFTTAQFALMVEANQGAVPADDDSLALLTEGISADALVQGAALIQLVVDGGAALPDGVTDTLALLTDPEATQAFIDSLPEGALQQAIADVANTVPASVAFAPGNIPAEYALYFPSPVGTVQSFEGGAFALLRFDDTSGSSGTVEWLTKTLLPDASRSWSLSGGVITVTPDALHGRFGISDCETPTGNSTLVGTIDEILRWELRRVARAGVDTIELKQFNAIRYVDPASCNDPLPPPREFSTNLLAFKTDTLPFAAADLVGAHMLPLVTIQAADDTLFDAFIRSALFDFDTSRLDAPGMQAGFTAGLADGRIHATLTRADGSASYDHEYRRYRSDGRKGSAVMAVVTRSDGARAIAGGMGVKADQSLTFTTTNAPGIYRSGLELGNFCCLGNGGSPFFIRLNDDAERTVTRASFNPTLRDQPTVDNNRKWSVEGDWLVLRRNGGSLDGLQTRRWLPVAQDGNRVYLVEQRWSIDLDDDTGGFNNYLDEQRSAFYDLVDAVQFERP
ncbi:MAG: carboxypeptidase-like regulatory domain-containing protein [Xanthomonadaceae bacterium]|nr:carboxypeptidase-like regulatory domain-containing protein [Xanthomonadaceae bacterium]